MSDAITSKPCTACGLEKPLEAFTKHKKGKFGRYSFCKVCAAAKTAARRELYREEALAATRAWREVNRQRVYEYNLAYRKANPNKVARHRRNYRKAHLQELRRKSSAYQKANPDKVRVREQNRRARKKGAGGEFTVEEFAAKLRQYKGRCHWCRKKIEGAVNADHLIPLAKGGSNDIGNIVPAHEFCNKSKGAKMPWEFMEGRLL